MNFFFGLSNELFKCLITIPKFQNNGLKSDKYYPFEAFIENNEWSFKKANYTENNDFFFIDNDKSFNEKFYFLSNDKEILDKNTDKKKLYSLNTFTDTKPVNFRCNLKLSYKDKGFSSYQSEYPYEMVKKKGNILSSISTLLNINADENYIFFRNIYTEPIRKKFKIYFIDLKTKSLVNETEVFTNTSNLININKSLINDNIYIFSKDYLGIPIFLSLKDNHLSMEHTHPPHHYILSEDNFKTIGKLKNDIKKQIFK